MKLGELPLQVAASETVYVFPEDYCEFGSGEITVFRRYGLDGNAPAVVDMVFTDQFNGEDITSIADNAFAGALDTESIDMSAMNSTVYIGDSAFNLPDLESLILPDRMVIGYRSFFACQSLTNIAFGSGGIGGMAFASCTSLGIIDISTGIPGVERYAFLDAPLTKITVGDELPANDEVGTFGVNGDFYLDYTENKKAAGAYAYDSGSGKWKIPK